MKKVITINLNGNAYQLEESGYEVMKAYLDKAATSLADNPDKDEIMRDIEQSIAEKCLASLSSNKTVVETAEVEKIVNDMGPVAGSEHSSEGKTHATHDGADSSKTDDTSSSSIPPKRLYQIREGALFSGVCNGLAAYFNIDVTLVRLIFIILTFITSGGFVLAYFIMMMVLPHAETAKDQASARGVPYTAQQFIDQAKKRYHEFSDKKEWRQWEKNWKKYTKHQHRWATRAEQMSKEQQYRMNPGMELLHSLMGMAWAVFIGWLFYWGYEHVHVIHEAGDYIGYLLQLGFDKAKAAIDAKIAR